MEKSLLVQDVNNMWRVPTLPLSRLTKRKHRPAKIISERQAQSRAYLVNNKSINVERHTQTT